MYVILFHFADGRIAPYGGGTYFYRGTKYAYLDNLQTKIYSSSKIARNCAGKLVKSCANLQNCEAIEIVEVRGNGQEKVFERITFEAA